MHSPRGHIDDEPGRGSVLIGQNYGAVWNLRLAPSPVRHGPEKDVAYESGMNPIGTARKRFNVRFYILAMTFLVFDVEIIFLYPWAVTFTQLQTPSGASSLFLGRIMFFIATSIIAYIYAWRKGVFRWD